MRECREKSVFHSMGILKLSRALFDGSLELFGMLSQDDLLTLDLPAQPRRLDGAANRRCEVFRVDRLMNEVVRPGS